MRLVLVATLVSLLAGFSPAQSSVEKSRNSAFDGARKILAAALGSDGGDEVLVAATQKALRTLPATAMAKGRLEAAMKRGGDGMRQALQSVHDDIAFRPLREAAMPPGFPEPTRVNEIEIKRYPAYRMARAPMKGSGVSGGNGAFWVLFRHIKKNDIAMTAPVQTDMNALENGDEASTMAFLYGSEDLGKVGKDGIVDVVDVAPLTVVSMGFRGRMSRKRFEQGHTMLKQWLRDNAEEWIAAGPVRSMGHNSPMVPSRKAFFEVQIPIEPKPRGTLH